MITITQEIAERVARELNLQPWTSTCWFDGRGRLLQVDHDRWEKPLSARWGLFGSSSMPISPEDVRKRLERREADLAGGTVQGI